jgi:hypothetical protein
VEREHWLEHVRPIFALWTLPDGGLTAQCAELVTQGLRMTADAAELAASDRTFLLAVVDLVFLAVPVLASGGEALNLTTLRAPKGECH